MVLLFKVHVDKIMIAIHKYTNFIHCRYDYTSLFENYNSIGVWCLDLNSNSSITSTLSPSLSSTSEIPDQNTCDKDNPCPSGQCCCWNSAVCISEALGCNNVACGQEPTTTTTTEKNGCQNPSWKGDSYCDDQNNVENCDWDGGDCCGDDVKTNFCQKCQCLDPNFTTQSTTSTTTITSVTTSSLPSNSHCDGPTDHCHGIFQCLFQCLFCSTFSQCLSNCICY